MDILGKGLSSIRRFNAGRRDKAMARLLADTMEAERSFMSEAKKFSIELKSTGSRSYYEVLGIKYTSDQKMIKDAYVRLVKRYHPDVSKEINATQRTEEINEAYATLKDRKSKETYDARSSRGANRMGTDATRSMARELLKNYSEARSRDFAEFRSRVATPQTRDSTKAAIEETVDWNRRFNRAADRTFGKFRDYGKRLRSLESENRSMLKGEKTEVGQRKLRENIAKLEGLVKTYQDAEKGISAAMKSVREELAPEENNIAERLRRSVQ